MAILDDLPEFEATVCVDGQPLSEYSDDENEAQNGASAIEEYKASRTVSKYVESTTGKEFSIKLSVAPTYVMDCEALSFYISIDGRRVRTPLLMSDRFEARKQYGGWEIVTQGVEVARNVGQNTSTIKKFVFSAVGTSNDNDQSESIKQDAKHMARVGKISILVQRAISTGLTTRPTQDGLELATQDIANVHEKALKGSAKSHGTSLGSSIQTTLPECYCVEIIDPNRPLAIFSFKYRSRAALKTLMVLPRTPEPEITNEDLTEEQRNQVEEFKRNLLAGGGPSRVKRENQDPTGGGRVKKPRLPDSGKGKGKAIVYDLTGDSD